MDHSDPLPTLFADDIVFHQPGRNPTSGDYQGLDAVPQVTAQRGP